MSDRVHLRPGPKTYVHIDSSLYHLEEEEEEGRLLKRVCVDCQAGEVVNEKGNTVQLIVHVDEKVIEIQNAVDGVKLEVPDKYKRGGIARVSFALNAWRH